jgi:hypothetical protein
MKRPHSPRICFKFFEALPQQLVRYFKEVSAHHVLVQPARPLTGEGERTCATSRGLTPVPSRRKKDGARGNVCALEMWRSIVIYPLFVPAIAAPILLLSHCLR